MKENEDPRASYTSQNIQNENIDICGKLITDGIVTKYNR